ncbi:MAG: 7-carboxy-7-deazaguanine synthase QueE [Thermoguttaceae bacterium]
MRVAETFHSRQGEGVWTGTESFFIRLAGCPRRCRYCDTPYALVADESPDVSIDDLVESVRRDSAEHVVITGGEPLASPLIESLVRNIRNEKKIVTIETSGVVFVPFVCELMSISPKMSNAGGPPPDRDVIERLAAKSPHQIKFVVGTESDATEAVAFLGTLRGVNRDAVYLMPQATNREAMDSIAAWLVPFCAEHKLRYAPRMQIIWYDNRRGA